MRSASQNVINTSHFNGERCSDPCMNIKNTKIDGDEMCIMDKEIRFIYVMKL